ncbi:hypothetical protein JTP67_32980, partial [Streptomyces sp. S12]|nr:hypothetical protein [Streptomyces sp. S12]
SLGWHEALGSSGTNKAIGEICAAMKLTKGAVTAEALPALRDKLLQADRIDAIDLPGLSSDRRPVIAGGILILEAAFNVLGLQRMAISKAAMREGVLYDMLGRGGADDALCDLRFAGGDPGPAGPADPALALRDPDRGLRGIGQLRPAGVRRPPRRAHRQALAGGVPGLGLRQLRAAVVHDLAARPGRRQLHGQGA